MSLAKLSHQSSVILIVLLFFYLLLSQQNLNAQEKVYTFGIVPQYDARKLTAIWRPILDELEHDTGYSFRLLGSPSISDYEIKLKKRLFDFAYINPYQAILVSDSPAYTPLVRDIANTLHGVLVVKKDSNIKTMSQLEGQIVAFPAPNALGASLLMRQELNDLFHLKIQPVYVKTHDSVYLTVLLGEVAAGGGVQKTLNRQKTDYQAALRILHQTTDVAPHPLTAHARVPSQVRDAVTASLLKMGQSREGMALLAKIPIKKIGTASLADYLPIKQLKLERFYQK